MPDLLRSALENALGCQYDILRQLGRGGMGTVYLARERSLERLVAIKVLPPEVVATPESRERFRREARTAAKLAHPNILPLYTFGELGGLEYYVMGYVRGESLAERLRVDGTLPCDEVRRVLADLADALDYAHRHGVIHRHTGVHVTRAGHGCPRTRRSQRHLLVGRARLPDAHRPRALHGRELPRDR